MGRDRRTLNEFLADWRADSARHRLGMRALLLGAVIVLGLAARFTPLPVFVGVGLALVVGSILVLKDAWRAPQDAKKPPAK